MLIRELEDEANRKLAAEARRRERYGRINYGGRHPGPCGDRAHLLDRAIHPLPAYQRRLLALVEWADRREVWIGGTIVAAIAVVLVYHLWRWGFLWP